MKAGFQLAAAMALGVVTFADVATSENYSITVATIDGGGGRSSAGICTNILVITPVVSRAVAQLPLGVLGISYGFASQLNNPPEATDDVRSHPQNLPVEIQRAALLDNDFDPDGDPLSIFSVDAVSEAGGTVELTATRVRYTPPPGLTTLDRFRYVLMDGSGDTSVATVTMGTAPPPGPNSPNKADLINQPDGSVLFRFFGPLGRQSFSVQFTLSLTTPNWQTIRTEEAATDGTVQFFIDPTLSAEGYYRVFYF